MIKPYECTQCGSTNFEDVNGFRVRCTFCGSLFEVLSADPKLVIRQGARVVFGKNANVEISGNMQIEDGADVELQGKVTLVKGNQKQLFKLKLVEGKGSGKDPTG
jgi:hypothetical protein